MVYTPRNPPGALFDTNPELALWLQDEFRDVSRSQVDTPEIRFTVLHAPPIRPREGMVVYADGTDWNPGSGAGAYVYTNGVWVPQGSTGGGGGPSYIPDTNTIYVRSGGSDSNDGLTVGTAVATISYAVHLALSYVWKPEITEDFPFIDIGPGTFNGATAAGYPMGSATAFGFPYLQFVGAGSASTTITSDGVSYSHADFAVFFTEGGMGAFFSQMTIDVPANMYGFVAQYHSKVLLSGSVVLNGTDTTSGAFLAKEHGVVGTLDDGTLGVSGTFGYLFSIFDKGSGELNDNINNSGTINNFCSLGNNSIFNCQGVTVTGNNPGGPVVFEGALLKNANNITFSSLPVLATGGQSIPSPTPTITGSSGLGSGSSVSLYTDAGTKNGYILMDTGSSPGNNGTVSLDFGEATLTQNFGTESGYFLIPVDGTGTWNGRAALVANPTFGSLTIRWNNGGANLAAGFGYYINYFSP